MAEEGQRLIMFTGTECTHCHEMEPLVKELEAKEKITVERIEVWHNAENAKWLEKVDAGRCGGVPFFYNEKTGKFLCGSASPEKLSEWALGK